MRVEKDARQPGAATSAGSGFSSSSGYPVSLTESGARPQPNGGTRSVASVSTGHEATTERGPPEHLQTREITAKHARNTRTSYAISD